MSKKLTQKDFVHTLSDENSVFVNAGNEIKQITTKEFREQMNTDDARVLNDLAFYIDINTPSASGSTRVDVGGNDNMRQIWENMKELALMDANGNYCELNKNDGRYTAEGEAVVDLSTGALLSKWSKADVMVIIPQHYGRIQTITVNNATQYRLWLSPVPLPNGFVIPQMVVGKFKAYLTGGAMRSIPYATPSANQTINGFWNYAQARSKNHGLANMDFRNHLLFHMMSKYGYRDSQNCLGGDGTQVWGVGLDGTESGGGFSTESGIKSGHTLSLGLSDGKVAITDTSGHACHGVNVAGFENPWGQYWEMVQGLCSVGTDVYCWRGNVMPTGTPTAATFDNIEHVTLSRYAATVNPNTVKMNIIASQEGQGAYMIPNATASGINYGDYFSYAASGQLWLFGGSSYNGAACGLACALSDYAWSYSNSYLSARLAVR